MSDDRWQSVLDFLEQESRFQGAGAAITGGAAAWWLKALLTPPPAGALIPHPTASRVAASLLALASFLFLIDQGRLAKNYGELARYLALDQRVSVPWSSHLVREIGDWRSVRDWLPYCVARAILLIVGVIVVWMLFAPLA